MKLTETSSFCLRKKGYPQDLVEDYGKEVTILNHSEGDRRTENKGLAFVYLVYGY